MNRSLYLFSILLFIGIIAVHFTVYMAYAGEANTVKGSKSNTDNRQVQPAPEPADGKTVKGSKSNASERQQSQDLSCGANGTSTCGGLCERRGDICIQDCADCPCACKAGF